MNRPRVDNRCFPTHPKDGTPMLKLIKKMPLTTLGLMLSLLIALHYLSS